MEQRKLGNTDISVSIICLGSMTWGEQNTQQDAHEQLDYATANGVNFIDTAEMYAVPPRAETQGKTEEFIGTWLTSRKNREKVIIATKVTGRSQSYPYIRGGETRLDRKSIEHAINGNLKRLQTDYVDLYQIHWPDRYTNYFGQLGYTHVENEDFIPIEETLDALKLLVTAGKVRHIGVSNESPWGLMQYLKCEDPRIVSVQNPYSLLNRTYEIGLSEISIREKCGLLAYSPLAFGYLSGKYLNGAKPSGARLTLPAFASYKRYINANAEKATSLYVELARKHGLDPAQMALSFVNSRRFVTSNIIGATTMEQLRSNIASASITLQQEVLSEIDAIHHLIQNPCP